ncbi:MAG: WD40 repeat domain-containing protein [Proteobacteria bacterium]|nr:WD40 repeat domain-containing protein [Pseudomonadota bacterium]
MKHVGPISGVATHKNFIATTGYDNQVILWDAQSGRALSRGLHDHLANQCSFSHDGTMLVSASSDYSARIWDIPSMQLRAALIGHTDDVDTAVFSPDDQYIATCALDRSIKIFDLNGRCLKTLTGHTGNVLTVAWSTDAKTLISSSVDGTLRHWDVASGRQIHLTCEGARTDTFETMGDGCVFSGDDRGRIAIIEGCQTRYIAAHKAGIKKLLLRENQNLLVTISYDRSIAFWRISKSDKKHPELTEISRSTLPALIWARAADFLDDARIVLGTFGSRYATFDWQHGHWDLSDIEPGQSLNAVATAGVDVYAAGDAGIVFKNGVKFSEMGSLCNFLLPVAGKLLTGGQLGLLFDAATGATLYEHHAPLNCGAAFYRDGKQHAAIGSYTGDVLVFAIELNGRLNLVSSRKIFENAVKGLAASDKTLFSVCANTHVVWQDIATLDVIKTVENAHERIANGCCRVGIANFASIGRDLKLLIWHDETFDAYRTPHKNSVKCIAASSDGKRIMTGSYGGTLAGFDVTDRQWTSFSRPTASGISSLAYDPLQNRFLAGAYDGRIYPVDESPDAA